jgi:hypothetical protein
LHLNNLEIRILYFILPLFGDEIPHGISEWCANDADCSALDTKSSANELEWNARRVFLAISPCNWVILLCCQS